MNTRQIEPAGTSSILSQIEHVLITERQGEQKGAEIVHLCVNHDERRPSANWNSSKGTWICRSGSSPECIAGGGWVDMAKRLGIELPSRKGTSWVEEGRWPIKDLAGNTVATHVRYRLPTGEKNVIWEGGLNGVALRDLPLYGAHLIKNFENHSLVVVVEGEKATDFLRTLGFQVVGTVTGAGTTPSKAVLACLDGFDVYLWADNDDPGRAHMSRIAGSLPAQPLWITWPESPAKGDAADLVEQGGTSERVLSLMAEATNPPAPLPSDVVLPFSSPKRGKEEGKTTEEPEISSGILDAAGILGYNPPPVQWQWGQRLPVGGLGLLASKPKVGKSQLLLGLALATCRGENFLGWSTRQGPVLFLAFEGHMRDVTNRLKQMGLRSDDALHLRVAPPPLIENRDKSIFDDWLEPLIAEIKPVLVIIDTLFRMIPGVVDANDYSLVNRALAPLEYLARRTEVTFLVSHHANKTTENTDDPGQAILGSTAILGAVDTALLMSRRKGAEGVTPGRELMSIQREGESLEPVVIALNNSGWPINGGRVEDFAIQTAKQRIRDLLSEAEGEELGAGELQQKVGGKTDYYKSARLSMLDSGEMELRQEGKRKFYRIRNPKELTV